MSGAQEPVGTLEVALAHAAKLLTSDPTLAAEQADEVLKVAPGHPVAMVILGASHRAGGNAPAALAILDPLARAYPDWVTPHYELGLALGLRGAAATRAIAALRRAVDLKPDMGDAWRALGDHLDALGDVPGRTRPTPSTSRPRPGTRACSHPRRRCATARSRSPSAASQHLKQFPTDVAAIRMLAEVAARLGRYADSKRCWTGAWSWLPDSTRPGTTTRWCCTGRIALPMHCGRWIDCSQRDPTDTGGANLKAALARHASARYSSRLRSTGRYSSEYPRHPKIWQSYGHALKTAGRQAESIAAYRRSIELCARASARPTGASPT